MILLIDSGSTHTFVTKAFVERAGCHLSAAPVVSVKVANGQYMTSDSQVTGLQWWTQGHTFNTDMRILDIGAYDAILGMDWLKLQGKMECDWEGKSLSFKHQGQQITLQGIISQQQKQLAELSVVQLQKWITGNEVWALALLDPLPATSPDQSVQHELPPDMQNLLAEYTDVFYEPKSLPPHRELDHAITLNTDARPVNT
uniref:Uncharacterized protein n=1 Tax=Avena sativa TaxID=4498 RepID=A0ACD5TK75_AVESA